MVVEPAFQWKDHGFESGMVLDSISSLYLKMSSNSILVCNFTIIMSFKESYKIKVWPMFFLWKEFRLHMERWVRNKSKCFLLINVDIFSLSPFRYILILVATWPLLNFTFGILSVSLFQLWILAVICQLLLIS